jgi:hypothetical protein
VTERRALRRAELALAAPAVTVALLVVVAALDVVRFHGLAIDAHVVIGAVSALAIARWSASVVRQVRAQRAFLARLPVIRATVVRGHAVRILAGRELAAFCAGLLRPAVYVSEGALAAEEGELRAILAHEEQHRRRRDPLRLLLARAAGDALRPLPPFAPLAEREATLADLAADAGTVDALGDRAPLASAMVRFEAVAPERVDRLVGTLHLPAISRTLLLAAATVSAAIATLAVTMSVTDRHPHMAVLLAATVPALLAARRASVRCA